MTAIGKRVMNGTILIINKQCPNCSHDRAWMKPREIYCSRCKSKIEVKK